MRSGCDTPRTQALTGHRQRRTIAASGLQELKAALVAPINEAFTNPTVHRNTRFRASDRIRDLNDLRDPCRIKTAQASSRP